jgi:hypothetical protein
MREQIIGAWLERQTDGQMAGWADGRMGGWTDRWTDKKDRW